MANSTSNIDLIAQSQASKEVTVNAALDALSPASTYGRRQSTCSGLTFGYYGGNVTLSGGAMSQIANGTLTLTPSATNYIVALKSTGDVSAATATTNWNDSANYWRLYSVVVGSATVTSYTDSRELAKYTGGGGSGGSGDMVLSSAQTNTGAKTFKAATLLLRNVADTFSSLFTNTATAARTWSLPDKNGTVAMTSDIREMLSGLRVYYVRTDGSDSNTGLVDSSGGAFLTIQKAINTALALDTNGFTTVISIKPGTYTSPVSIGRPTFGGGSLIIAGSTGTASDIVISTTSANAIALMYGAIATVQDLKIQTTTSGHCLWAIYDSLVTFSNIEFGSCAENHIDAVAGGKVTCATSYKISGGAGGWHLHSHEGGWMNVSYGTVTITGTPAFAAGYAGAAYSVIQVYSLTFVGAATGVRYLAHKNALIDTSGQSLTYLPGSVAGAEATGGRYT